MSLDVNRTALAGRQRDELAEELIGGLLKRFAAFDLAASALALQLEVPILGKMLRLAEAIELGAGAVIATVQIGRALPETRVLAPVNVE